MIVNGVNEKCRIRGRKRVKKKEGSIKTHKKRGVKQSKMQQNAQNDEKFSKRVFTNSVLCGKLWENFVKNKARARFVEQK